MALPSGSFLLLTPASLAFAAFFFSPPPSARLRLCLSYGLIRHSVS
jgi:hypothetical protein